MIDHQSATHQQLMRLGRCHHVVGRTVRPPQELTVPVMALQLRENGAYRVISVSAHGPMTFLFGNQQFVQLLTRPDSRYYCLDRPVLDERGGDIDDLGRRCARNIGFAAARLAHRHQNDIDRFLQAQQEPGHSRIGDRYRPAVSDLVVK